MIRLIATVAAGAMLGAGLAWVEPPAHAAPQSSQPAPRGGSSHSGTGGTVMRGSDTISLVAMLPWWRPDESSPPGSNPGELESPVLTACDLWLGFPYATADAQSLTVRLSAAQNSNEIDLVSNRIRVIDPGELNEVDLTAPDEPPRTGGSWLLRGLLALVGGALAAFSAVRYLVA
jgi:hypothetical protein